ncbi:DUF460 domain-containing protein [Natrononativus amylolyticus]|uniref:DUF460 domain-containing protein n=1 Tax=Natrononativus amylolyticus TaxID=2963434 RepID=UPI0020CED6A1|nr:DUF460 domain-containing protein [Natrononativus amylolyticus]
MSTRTSALDAVVFGVDIQSGDVRGDSPSYALVVYDGDDEGLERDVVSHRKLRRLIGEEEPAIVATDNMYELAADKDQLIHFLGSLPDETRLVQVTGAEQPEPLSRVAKRHGIPYAKEPMAEAEAAARLAAHNVGHEVSAFTDTTTVKVSRGRSTGKGGWSEDRYTRRIHGAVKRQAREVESELEAHNLEYDRDVRESYGGFANAIFTVEARPADIPVSNRRSGDVRIEIERERRDGIEFRPLVKRRDHVVVGVDPGTTTAVAVVSLEGEVLDVWSSRTSDAADVIEWIVERGRPVIVAADVTPMPETVEKFRRSFDAAGWTPERDPPIDEKQHRTREHPYDDDHQRDAMAAALYAFDAHEDQFERIARKLPPGVDRDEVTARVVSGEESVEAVLRDLTESDESEVEEPTHQPRELTPEEKRIRSLERQVDRLEGHVETLEGRLEKRDETIEDLEAELAVTRREERRKVRKDREVTRLERKTEKLERERDAAHEEVADLEKKVERMKALWKLDHSNFSDVSAKKEGLVPVKVVEKFSKGAIREADEQYGIAAGDVVYLRDASGAGRSTAELLAGFEPRVVLKNGGGLSEIADAILFDREVPVGPADDVAMQEVDELAVAREDDVEAVIDDWRERAAERRKEQNASMVDRLISEHRAGDNEA